MNEKMKKLILGRILKRTGNFNPNSYATSFDQRLIFQKTIYLLQAFGLYLGYVFSWYIRGPYSSELARKGYDLTRIYHTAPKVRFSRKISEEKFKIDLMSDSTRLLFVK